MLGNKLSPVAVAVVISASEPSDYDRELVRTAIESGAAIAGFVKTCNIGIEKIIANLMANPNIRYLIVTGKKDNEYKVGRALYHLWRNGVDENMRVVGINDVPAVLSNLTHDEVERLRRQVTVIPIFPNSHRCDDVESTVTIGSRSFRTRGIRADGDTIYVNCIDEKNLPIILSALVHSCLQEPESKVNVVINGERYELYDRGAEGERYVCKFLRGELEVRSAEQMLGGYMFVDLGWFVYCVFPDVATGYNYIVSKLKEIGIERPTRHGMTREVCAVILYQRVPRFEFREDSGKIEIVDFDVDDIVRSRYPIKDLRYFKAYCEDILNGVPPVEGERLKAEYTYGHQLRRYGEDMVLRGIKVEVVDQIEHLIANMMRYPLERFHVLTFWNPFLDVTLRRGHKPCFCMLDLKVVPRGDRYELDAILLMRSHDFVNAHVLNMYGVAAIMNYIVWRLRKEKTLRATIKDVQGERTIEIPADKIHVGRLLAVITSCHVYI